MKSRAVVSVGIVSLSIAGLILGPVSQANAQIRKTDPGVINVFLPAPREARQRLTQAREALDEQRFADAVDNLDKLLRDPENEDFFIGSGPDEGTQTSIKAEALRLLGGMPKKGREVYELSFGAEARKLLDEAVAEGDLTKLTEVTRMFFHTKAGYEATMLLGRYQLDRGRPLAGALCLKRVADVPAALDEFDPELSLLLSACWLQAGVPAKAEESLVSLHNRKPKATVRIGTQDVKLFEQPTEALAWLQKTIGDRQLFGPREASQWAMFRGDPARNAPSAGSAPLLSYRWRVPTANDPRDEEQVKQVNKKYRDQGWPALPGLHPLAVQDYVLMRTPNRVIAVNLKTGKRVWEYPWTAALGSGTPAPATPNPASGQGTPQREYELGQRLWEDAPFGQLSSDGNLVFVIDDMGFAAVNPYGPRVVIINGGRQIRNAGFDPFNTLVALSLKREGATEWIIQGKNGDGESRLAGAFFLGPPLPLHGSLYALIEINSEIRLAVLNAKTGALEWSQQLAHVDNRTIMTDITRRLAGATPSYADGVLICPTSAGALVAVDISTRSLLWGYQYEQNRQPNNQFGGFNGNNIQQRGVGNRWADATAAIADGKVLITPIESDKMYCLDLATGKLAWPAQKRVDGASEHLYVAGVKEGRIVLVGKNKVTAVKLADGTPAWSAAVDLSAMPSGRGFLSDKFYYLPTVDSKLTKIDVNEGKLVQQVATGQVLGNLISYKDQIISHGVDWLYAYHQNEPLRASVAKRLEKDANDGWALARQAEIYLQDGKPTEAIGLLRRAHELKIPGEGDSIRSLLVSTLLSALREDFAANEKIAAEIEAIVEQPSQRTELRRLLAVGFLKTGQTERAFEAFVRLSGLDDGAQPLGDGSRLALERVDKELSVRRDRWVQGHLGKLLAVADPAQRAKMDEVVKTRLEAALKADAPQGLRQFVDYFGSHPAADRARFSLAQKLIDKDNYLEAELLLGGLERSSDETLAASAAAEMARLFERAGHIPEAVGYYRQLSGKYAQVVCRAGKTGSQVVEGLAAESPVKKLLANPVTWLSGQADVKESGDGPGVTRTGGRAVSPIKLRDARGSATGTSIIAYDPNLNALVFRDGLGKERLQVSVNRADGSRFYTSSYSALHGKANGHLAVVSIGFDVLAVDSLRSESGSVKDALLWRQDLSSAVVAGPGVPNVGRVNPSFRTLPSPWGDSRHISTDPQGRLAGETGPLNAHGICLQKMRDLHCVDPLTGETVWIRDGIEPGSQLFGDEERVFAVSPNANEALVLSALDGTLLGKRKVDPFDNRWATLGGRVLAWSQGQTSLVLRLADVWGEKDVWNREFPLGSRGCLVGHDEVAIFQPDGKFVVLSLVDDKPRVEQTLEPENLLMSIHMFRSKEQYFLATNRPNTRPSPDVNIQPPLVGNLAPMIVGRVYAFDRASGKPQWQSPAFIDRYGLPLDQPADVPVLTFLRHITKLGKGVPNQTQSSMLCLDRRDGRMLFAKDDIPQTMQIYSIVGDPEKQLVSVQLPSRVFNITFTDQPRAPEPPAQTGEASSIALGSGAGLSGKMTDAVLNIFTRGLAPRPFPLPLRGEEDPFGARKANQAEKDPFGP